MARTGKIASRYARAIYGLLGGTEGSTEKVRGILGELEPLAKALEGEPNAQKLFSSQVLNDKQRSDIAEDLSKQLKLSELSRRTLLVLAAGKRLGYLPSIVEKLKRMVLEN